MKIGIPCEIHSEERRVACTPDECANLIELGYEVVLQSGCGQQAGFPDQHYEDAGGRLVDSAREVWIESDLICKVRPPQVHPDYDCLECEWLDESKTLIGFIWPAQNESLMDSLRQSGASVLALDAVPRLSRSQKLDALSSMANIAGYRAVIEASQHFGRFFPGQITAAGRIPPARVLVIGAGVAGLAAIGAAVNLGAQVRAFDTRPEVREQVESMNAEFIEVEFEEQGEGSGGYAREMSEEFIKAELALFAEQAKQVDIIITTALIPGKPAPRLLSRAMIDSMRPGSVVVDLAAEQGGNCEYTEPGKVVVENKVTIIGYTDLVSRMATQSSQMYAANVRHLITDLTPDKDGKIHIDMDDEVIRGTTVVHRGEITWPPPAPKPSNVSKPSTKPAPAKKPQEVSPRKRLIATLTGIGIGGAAILGMGSVAPAEFMSHFSVFVLACFIGWQVIWNVTPALHTPLMSVTNAISGIIIIGAMIEIGSPSSIGVILSIIAVTIASINVVGGFMVTQRMLNMFRK